MSRVFFSYSEHRRREYDPSGAAVKDILPLLRTAREGEQRAALLRGNGDEAASETSSLRPGNVPRLASPLRVTGQRVDQRIEIMAGSMPKDGPHRGALSRRHR